MMGVFLFVSMNPYMVEPDKWREVYSEAMLISDYEGLACIKNKSYNQIEVPCLANAKSIKVRKSRDEVLNRYIEEKPNIKLKCWNCIGDIFTGSNMEYFDLYDNIDYYRYECENTYYATRNIDMEKVKTIEMLFELINYKEFEDKYGNYTKAIATVMGAKTQGEYGHMGLLEIACLLADTFPDAISIRGDITYAQCMAAVSHVEKILGRTIKLPVQYDYTIVYERLSKVVERSDLLSLMDNIYDGPKDEAYYKFMQLNFTEIEIAQHYIARYSQDNKKMLIREWFKQNRTLEKLCEIVEEAYKTQESYSTEICEFIDALIQCKVHVEDKIVEDPTELNSVNQCRPDTVGMQFSKILGQYVGLKNYYVDKYIPIGELIEVCMRFWGDTQNIQDIFEEAIAKVESDDNLKLKDNIYDTMTSLDTKLSHESDEIQRETNDVRNDEKFTHEDFYSLCEWDCNDIVCPELDDDLLCIIERLKEFGEEAKEEYTTKYKYKENIGKLTDVTNFIQLISKHTSHSKLFKENDLDYILSEEFPRESMLGSVIIGLHVLQVNNTTNIITRAFCLNFELLRFYVDKCETVFLKNMQNKMK